MATKQSHSINLLSASQPTEVDKFFSWALGAGRFIIILTETIALATFLYRFGLDRQIIDLHDKIKWDQRIVAEFSDNEKTYRNLQSRLQEIKTLSSANTPYLKHFHDLINLARGSVVFDQLDITNSQIVMTVRPPYPGNLRVFINKLKAYPDITSVSIDQVQNNTSSGTIEVSITASLKGGLPNHATE